MMRASLRILLALIAVLALTSAGTVRTSSAALMEYEKAPVPQGGWTDHGPPPPPGGGEGGDEDEVLIRTRPAPAPVTGELGRSRPTDPAGTLSRLFERLVRDLCNLF